MGHRPAESFIARWCSEEPFSATRTSVRQLNAQNPQRYARRHLRPAMVLADPLRGCWAPVVCCGPRRWPGKLPRRPCGIQIPHSYLAGHGEGGPRGNRGRRSCLCGPQQRQQRTVSLRIAGTGHSADGARKRLDIVSRSNPCASNLSPQFQGNRAGQYRMETASTDTLLRQAFVLFASQWYAPLLQRVGKDARRRPVRSSAFHTLSCNSGHCSVRAKLASC